MFVLLAIWISDSNLKFTIRIHAIHTTVVLSAFIWGLIIWSFGYFSNELKPSSSRVLRADFFARPPCNCQQCNCQQKFGGRRKKDALNFKKAKTVPLHLCDRQNVARTGSKKHAITRLHQRTLKERDRKAHTGHRRLLESKSAEQVGVVLLLHIELRLHFVPLQHRHISSAYSLSSIRAGTSNVIQPPPNRLAHRSQAIDTPNGLRNRIDDVVSKHPIWRTAAISISFYLVSS